MLAIAGGILTALAVLWGIWFGGNLIALDRPAEGVAVWVIIACVVVFGIF